MRLKMMYGYIRPISRLPVHFVGRNATEIPFFLFFLFVLFFFFLLLLLLLLLRA
jgi:hypothetical protein